MPFILVRAPALSDAARAALAATITDMVAKAMVVPTDKVQMFFTDVQSRPTVTVFAVATDGSPTDLGRAISAATARYLPAPADAPIVLIEPFAPDHTARDGRLREPKRRLCDPDRSANLA